MSTEEPGKLNDMDALLGELSEAVVVVDRSGIVLLTNREEEHPPGRSGSSLSDLPRDVRAFHLDGRPYEGGEWPLARVLTSGEAITEEEFDLIDADGRRQRVTCSCAPFHDDDGRVVGAVSVVRDVTEQRSSHEQLAYLLPMLDQTEDAIIGFDAQWRVTAWNNGAAGMYGWSAEQALGHQLGSLVPHDLTDAQKAEIRRQTAASGRWRGEIAARRRDGSVVPVEVELISVAGRNGDGTVAGYLGIHRDVSRRRRAEADLQRRGRQQAAVAQLGRRALEDGHVQSLLDDAVTVVCRTLEVEYAMVDELLPGGERLLLRAGVGWREGVVGTATEAAGRGSPAGHALLFGQPVIVDDMAGETRFQVPPVLLEHDVLSEIRVVIDPHGPPFGTLAALSTRQRAFSQDDVSFMQAVANVLASVVERAQTDQRLEAAREAERSRIARDLHDEALGGLTEAVVLAQRAKSAAPGDETADLVARLLPTLTEVGHQLRAAIYDLRLPREEHRPFTEMLESLIALHRTQAAASGIDIDLEVRGQPVGSIGPRGTQVLRIIGEALTNARHHSAATTIRVRLSSSGRTLTVDASDDGRGFDASAPASRRGMGIRGMRERAAMAGARLTIDSRPSAGTRVHVKLPLGAARVSAERTRVLLVEDHAAVRQAIATALSQEDDFEVVGEAGSLAEARQMLDQFDVAIVDLALPDGYGGVLITELRERNPEAQALVLTASLDRAQVARAVESGATAVINKTAPLEQLLTDIRRLRSGETLLGREEVVELLSFAGRQRDREYRDQQALASLTPRERDVLQALADGLNNQQIADRLHITVRTVHNHVANILAKLGVHSRLQAVVFALRYRLVEIDTPAKGGGLA